MRLKRQDGAIANQLRKAMAVAAMKLGQWFSEHSIRSSLMRMVTPADALAAAQVAAPMAQPPMEIMVVARGVRKERLRRSA